MGATTPVGPLDFVRFDRSWQRPRRKYRRVCLLKGCEQLFLPSHPLQRYCSKSCQQAARSWRRWRAAQRYRATEQGRQQRRAQSRRYRQRQRLRQATPVVEQAVTEETAAELNQPQEAVLQGEGQRYPGFSEVFSGTPCRRPGCYELFQPRSHEPPQCFCCSACRRALRRVLDREARWRRRRRLLRARFHRPPPRC